MKEKIKVKRLNRRCNSESAKEVPRTSNNKGGLTDEQGRIICPVPLVDCKHPGNPVIEGPETSVKMKCSYNNCQLQSKPIHMDCFRMLEEKMMTILQHLPHRTSRWTAQQMRNNLWDKKGMSLIEKHMRCKCNNGVVVRDEDAWDKAQKQLHAGEEKKRKANKKRTLPALGTRSVSECIDFNDEPPASSLNYKPSQPTIPKYPIGYAPVSDEKENKKEKPNVSSVTEFPPLSEENWQVAESSRRRGMSFSTAAKSNMKPLTTIIPSAAQDVKVSKSPIQDLLSTVVDNSVPHSYPKVTPIEPPKFLSSNIVRTSAIDDLSLNNNEWEWDVESDFYECERPAELGNRYRYDETDDWGFSHNFAHEGTCDFPRSFGQDSGYRHTVVLLMTVINTSVLTTAADRAVIMILDVVAGTIFPTLTVMMIVITTMTCSVDVMILSIVKKRIDVVGVMIFISKTVIFFVKMRNPVIAICILKVTTDIVATIAASALTVIGENTIYFVEEVLKESSEEDGSDQMMIMMLLLISVILEANSNVKSHRQLLRKNVPGMVFCSYGDLWGPYSNPLYGAFFKISTAIGFTDICGYIFSYPDLKMPLCIFFADLYWKATPGYWVNICVFFVYYFNYTREYLLVANAANRLTALMFPHKHDYYWSLWLVPVLVLCFLLGIPGSYHVLFGSPLILPFNSDSNDSFVLTISFTLYQVDSSFNGAVQACVTGLASLILNLTSLYLLRKKMMAKTKKVSRTQTSLFFIALWDFFFEMIWGIHQAWVYTFVLRNDLYNPIFDTLYLVVPWLGDFVTLSRPYIILALCKQARTIFFNTSATTRIIIVQSSTIQSTGIKTVSGTHSVVK
ncbi:hypothetical protein FO519_001797 [Halicephalobus sp. NKZ332]|nr:hypothetical protein FO519_001797 [Halicephalobus sp. NKZ332]